MAYALNTFLDKLSKDQLRTTNMWELQITTGYNDVDSIFKHITMYVDGFTAPSRSQEYVDVGFKGTTFPVPTVFRMQQDHTMTVRADVNGEIRRACLAWQAKTCDPDIEGGSVLGGDRRLNTNSVVRLQLLDDDMNKVAEVYKLIGVKVANVGEMSMSNNDGNLATFELSLKSNYWQVETAANGAFKTQR